MELGTIIRRRRKELGRTQDDVAQRAGISKPYLSNIETGRAKNPPSDAVLEALAGALEFEPMELMRVAQLERMPNDVRRRHVALEAELAKLRGVVREFLKVRGRGDSPAVPAESLLPDADDDSLRAVGAMAPVINRVETGYPREFTDPDSPAGEAVEYVRCPDMRDPRALAVRVCGQAMEPKYHEGDIVVVSPNTPAQPGDDCFVCLAEGGGTEFLRYYRDDERTVRLQPLNDAHRPRLHPAEKVTSLWPAVYRIERLRG